MSSCWSKAGIAALVTIALLGVGCNDVYRPIVNPIPLPGGDPGSADYVAVLNQNPSGDRDIVTFINVSGDTNIGNRLVGPGAVWLAWDGGRSVTVVPNASLDTVTEVSFTNTAIATATLFSGSQPFYSFSRNAANSYVLNRGANIDCPSSGSIGILLTAGGSLQSDFCVGPHPVFSTQTGDGVRVIVLDDNLNEAWIVNLVTKEIEAKLPVGTGPVWAVLSSDNSTAYVLNKASADITVLDVTNKVVRNTSIPTNGTSPSYLVLDSRRTRLYVSNQGSDTVTPFDISAKTPQLLHAPISLGAGASPYTLAVLADGSAVFVADTGTNAVTRIDGNSFLTTPIPVTQVPGAKVTWVASSISGAKVYATFTEPTDLNNGTVVIRTTDNVITTTIAAPRQDVPSCDPTVATCGTVLMRPAMVVSRQ